MAKKKNSPMPQKANAKTAAGGKAKTPVKKAVVAKSAGKKAAPMKKAAMPTKKKVPAKKTVTTAKANTAKRVAAKPTPRKAQKAARPEPRATDERKTSMQGRGPVAPEANAASVAAPQQATQPNGKKRKGGFARQLHRLSNPNESHPGQTAEHGPTHDRAGSQLERERHSYPNGNQPNAGSARSAQYKGKRRDNMSQG